MAKYLLSISKVLGLNLGTEERRGKRERKQRKRHGDGDEVRPTHDREKLLL